MGHYGHPALERPGPGSELSTLELDDVTQWQVVKGPYIDDAIAQNAPHPVWYVYR